MSVLLKFNRIQLNGIARNVGLAQRYLSAESPIKPETDGESSKAGFAKAFESHTEVLKPKEKPADNETFASLLRNSKFIDVSGNNYRG